MEIDLENEFKTEVSTKNNRRMDIYLETDNSIVCIENKIFAGDQENQLSDYWEEISTRAGKKKKAYLIYLSLDGHKPSEGSIDPNVWSKLITKGSAFKLSYHDIEKWLKSSNRLKTGVEENEVALF
ncbi:MAG: PD-(D/E)XK nuclease family protein [Brevinema sp.]